MIPKKTFLEVQYCDNAGRKRSVGKIKNRPEKYKTLPAPKWYPRGKMSILNNGEIQHIHDLAMQEACISVGREHFGDVIGILAAVFKNEPVEHAVDQVTKGARKNEGSANDKPRVISVRYNFFNIKNSENHRP